jgi:hypothetical protein
MKDSHRVTVAIDSKAGATVGRYAKWSFSVSVAAVAATFFCVVLVCATLTTHLFLGSVSAPLQRC